MEKNKTNKLDGVHLTPHFTLEEMTRTNVKLGYLDRQQQTQPDEKVMENLTRACQWLELLLERNARGYWLHFAVKPEGNRRKISLINVI